MLPFILSFTASRQKQTPYHDQSQSGSHTSVFQFQAVVLPDSNDCLSPHYITLLIPGLMHPDVHPWI